MSTPHSWRHKRACKALLDWYSDKQHALSLKNTLLESSPQKTRSPIFPCPCSRASSSQVQLHLDNRSLGNSNSPLIRTKSDSLRFTSYIYCKFNLENPKPRSQQCFVAFLLCISPMILFTASDFMLCLSEIQSPNALRASIFRQVCGAQNMQPFQQVGSTVLSKLINYLHYMRFSSVLSIASSGKWSCYKYQIIYMSQWLQLVRNKDEIFQQFEWK